MTRSRLARRLMPQSTRQRLDTHFAKRDEHLKSPDFFDVAKYPTLTFKSTKVVSSGKGHYKVTGDLTMHGVTKSVVLDVDSPATEAVDMMGNTKRGFTATTTVHREDFGLTWNKVRLGSDVAITIDGELAKQKAPPAADAKQSG